GLIGFLAISYWFHIVLNYRSVGFEAYFQQEFEQRPIETKHVGLNMMSELCFINTFYEAGVLDLSYGLRYLQELVNFIPRAIWPEKPLLGIEYAVLRGFGGTKSGSDIGVLATISSGLIGQGFLNFGPFGGPAAAAI